MKKKSLSLAAAACATMYGAANAALMVHLDETDEWRERVAGLTDAQKAVFEAARVAGSDRETAWNKAMTVDDDVTLEALQRVARGKLSDSSGAFAAAEAKRARRAAKRTRDAERSGQ